MQSYKKKGLRNKYYWNGSCSPMEKKRFEEQILLEWVMQSYGEKKFEEEQILSRRKTPNEEDEHHLKN